MTLLQLIKEFCRRSGITVPVAVATSGDDQVLQLMGLMNELLEDLEERKAFSFLQKQATITTIAGSDQGSLASLVPGIVKITSTHMYNRITNEIIRGPIQPDVYQLNQIYRYPISNSEFRIMGGNLLFVPALTTGSTVAFEYQTQYPVEDATTSPTTSKSYFTKDTDTCLFPDRIMLQGIRWMWRREKGLRFSDNQRSYEAAVANLGGNDPKGRTLHMDDDVLIARGVQIPDMNWDLE